MGETAEITGRMRMIETDCGWIAGEINYLNNQVDSFKGKIQNLETEISALQQIQDAILDSGAEANDRLAELMLRRRRNLVELQYALRSAYDELRKLETSLLKLQEEAYQLSITLSFSSMSIAYHP